MAFITKLLYPFQSSFGVNLQEATKDTTKQVNRLSMLFGQWVRKWETLIYSGHINNQCKFFKDITFDQAPWVEENVKI